MPRNFAPGDAEQVWARRVLDAVAAASGATIAIDGKKVYKPVILRAGSHRSRVWRLNC